MVRGLVKAPLGLPSPPEVYKDATEADFHSSDKAFWDPFGLHFGIFVVSFLHFSFSMILSPFWGRFGGRFQSQKLVFY